MVKQKRQADLEAQFTPRPEGEVAGTSMRGTLTSPQETLRHLTIQVPVSLRDHLRVVAAQRRISVRQIVTEAIDEWLGSHT